jgi:hypothetical protein
MTQVFHSDVNNVVPWQANYSFPSQTTKSEKTMIKLNAKNGKSPFVAHDTIRFEFPSDQYLNALNTLISFDVRINEDSSGKSMYEDGVVSVTDGVVTLTTAVGRLTSSYYAGYYLEFNDPQQGVDGQRYLITSHAVESTTATLTLKGFSGKSIATGTGYKVALRNGSRLQDGGAHALFRRLKISYGGMPLEDINDYNIISRALIDTGVGRSFLHGTGAILEGTNATYLEDTKFWRTSSKDALLVAGETQAMDHVTLNNENSWKRMCFRPFAGLLNCKKLIPLKWMASSLVLELTIARDTDCIIAPLASNFTPKIEIQNPQVMAELVNFDSTYDAGFYYGMQQFGVPLRFSTWSNYTHNPTGNNQMMQIHSRARSIKLALAMVRDSQSSYQYDSNRFYQAVTAKLKPSSDGQTVDLVTGTDTAATYGSCGQITEFQWRIGGRYWPAQPVDCTNGGAEAYVELLKTMDALGDYTFANNVDPRDWHTDYDLYGGNKFLIAGHFEMTDVNPDTISGINGEEQSDIMLNIKAKSAFERKTCDVFVAYDALLIIKPENEVELVY